MTPGTPQDGQSEGDKPWGNAIVISAFIPGPPSVSLLKAAEVAMWNALDGHAVELYSRFERLETRPVHEETMGQ